MIVNEIKNTEKNNEIEITKEGVDNIVFSQLLSYNVYVVGGDRMKKRQLKKNVIILILSILLVNNIILYDAIISNLNYYIIIFINALLTFILIVNKCQ